ncbi:MAG TPA: substrate-binding domain-containing protein [Methylophilaceae bacterium]|nr:substrate-binding domain-containing protein [Methylophilaceae bacterium]
MQRFKHRFAALLLALLAISPAMAANANVLRLATTTSTENSGLLDYLLPKFEQSCACQVHVIAVGTGKALKLGEDGNVDVVLVHARPAEDAFIAAGHGIDRHDVMYNDFVLIGPPDDPATIKGASNAVSAMQKIANSHAKFISRGDDSGTDKMEKNYWSQAGIKPDDDNTPRWYYSAGQGMGEVLMMAAEMHAYTLTDRGTYLSYRDKLGLPILLEGDPSMFNPYGIIAVNPKKYPEINYRGATALINWITSEAGQQLIASYKVDGEQLFVPSAKK